MFGIQDTLTRGTTNLKEEPNGGTQVGAVRTWIQPAMVEQGGRYVYAAVAPPESPYTPPPFDTPLDR